LFTLHVERQVEAEHHNGPASSRCHNVHGHSWLIEVEITFGESELDEWGWGTDFGVIKSLIEEFDHDTLNQHPLMGGLAPSAENLARVIYFETISRTGMQPDFVRVHEGKGNTMTYRASEQATTLIDPRNGTQDTSF
jgi:6-pyruvoyl-tetrahydropterin synthase